MARLIALDVGEARIGVAVCDVTGFLASPYTTLHVSRNTEEQTRAAILHLIDETEAEGLVVGLPISLDGKIHAQGERIQFFAQQLQPYLSIPLQFWDERLSTVEAHRLLAERGQGNGKRSGRTGRQPTQRKRRRQKGQEIDALAATVILQDYLDHAGSKSEERDI